MYPLFICLLLAVTITSLPTPYQLLGNGLDTGGLRTKGGSSKQNEDGQSREKHRGNAGHSPHRGHRVGHGSSGSSIDSDGSSLQFSWKIDDGGDQNKGLSGGSGSSPQWSDPFNVSPSQNWEMQSSGNTGLSELLESLSVFKTKDNSGQSVDSNTSGASGNDLWHLALSSDDTDPEKEGTSLEDPSELRKRSSIPSQHQNYKREARAWEASGSGENPPSSMSNSEGQIVQRSNKLNPTDGEVLKAVSLEVPSLYQNARNLEEHSASVKGLTSRLLSPITGLIHQLLMTCSIGLNANKIFLVRSSPVAYTSRDMSGSNLETDDTDMYTFIFSHVSEMITTVSSWQFTLTSFLSTERKLAVTRRSTLGSSFGVKQPGGTTDGAKPPGGTTYGTPPPGGNKVRTIKRHEDDHDTDSKHRRDAMEPSIGDTGNYNPGGSDLRIPGGQRVKRSEFQTSANSDSTQDSSWQTKATTFLSILRKRFIDRRAISQNDHGLEIPTNTPSFGLRVPGSTKVQKRAIASSDHGLEIPTDTPSFGLRVPGSTKVQKRATAPSGYGIEVPSKPSFGMPANAPPGGTNSQEIKRDANGLILHKRDFSIKHPGGAGAGWDVPNAGIPRPKNQKRGVESEKSSSEDLMPNRAHKWLKREAKPGSEPQANLGSQAKQRERSAKGHIQGTDFGPTISRGSRKRSAKDTEGQLHTPINDINVGRSSMYGKRDASPDPSPATGLVESLAEERKLSSSAIYTPGSYDGIDKSINHKRAKRKLNLRSDHVATHGQRDASQSQSSTISYSKEAETIAAESKLRDSAVQSSTFEEEKCKGTNSSNAEHISKSLCLRIIDLLKVVRVEILKEYFFNYKLIPSLRRLRYFRQNHGESITNLLFLRFTGTHDRQTREEISSRDIKAEKSGLKSPIGDYGQEKSKRNSNLGSGAAAQSFQQHSKRESHADYGIKLPDDKDRPVVGHGKRDTGLNVFKTGRDETSTQSRPIIYRRGQVNPKTDPDPHGSIYYKRHDRLEDPPNSSTEKEHKVKRFPSAAGNDPSEPEKPDDPPDGPGKKIKRSAWGPGQETPDPSTPGGPQNLEIRRVKRSAWGEGSAEPDPSTPGGPQNLGPRRSKRSSNEGSSGLSLELSDNYDSSGPLHNGKRRSTSDRNPAPNENELQSADSLKLHHKRIDEETQLAKVMHLKGPGGEAEEH